MIILKKKENNQVTYERESWDVYFMRLAELASTRSKDPSTKVGSIIVDKNYNTLSTGYNGLPRGVEDSAERLENREIKYKCILHAEENAILSGTNDRNFEGGTIYTWPLAPCSNCASKIIQVGIKRVVFLRHEPRDNFGFDLDIEMFNEAGVEWHVLDLED